MNTARMVPSLPEASRPWSTRSTLRRLLGVEPLLEGRELLEQGRELLGGLLLAREVQGVARIPRVEACRGARS